MKNAKVLFCIAFMIFLVVMSVITIMISLKNKSSTSIESDEIRNTTDETNNASYSAESIAFFYEKRPQVSNWTNFDFEACLKLPNPFKFKEAKWNVNDFTTTKNPIDHYYGPGINILNNRGGQQSWNLMAESLGDLKCHDFFNRPECLFDLGDCCQKDTFQDIGKTCFSCYCYSEFDGQECNGLVEFVADGFCDDLNNNIECYFDGGDCCFDVVQYFCQECLCFYSDLTNSSIPPPS